MTAPDLLDPATSEASVDAELRRLGVDPVAVGERGEAFVALAKENARLVEKVLALQAVEHASRTLIDAVFALNPALHLDSRYRFYCKALAALAKVRP